MRKAILCGIVALAVISSLPALVAAQPPQSSYEMEMYHVVLMKKGPNWKPQHDPEGFDVRMKVIDGLRKGASEGVLATAGLVNDEPDVEFILILRVETKTEVLEMANRAPNIKSGFFVPEIYSWFAPKGLNVAPPRSMAPTGN